MPQTRPQLPPGEHTLTSVQMEPGGRPKASTRITIWFARNWMLVFSLFYGLFVGLPFIAPVLMEIGWVSGGKAIYLLYTFLCHQLPQRSFFLFGKQSMYELPIIQANFQNTLNPLVLRQFIGNSEMGWKVAWSDRMVSMYASILFWGWLWYPVRRKIKGLPLWGFILLALPLALDGATHFLSDFAGLGQGFRDSNAWLAAFSGQFFPAAFYSGDSLGTFNSWMRFLTGVLFGLGAVWYTFPILQTTALQTCRLAQTKFRQAGTQFD